jgi:CheY-like chemotaxis protein
MSKRSALIIDDEPDARSYLSTVLIDHGWTARTAESANKGLDLARQEPPDVVLLDVMMPERGGLSTLIALRKDPQLKSVPVVLVTGIQGDLTVDFDAFLARFKAYHPDAYLEKPVTPDELLATLDKVTAAPAE